MKIENIRSFRKLIIDWYHDNKRDLPWRQTRDPYRIWVSEVMAQQTRIETIIPYYQRFTERFPDINALAKATLQQVLKMWEGLGYYSRARNLHKAAKIIVETRTGIFPDEYDKLLSLPGIGPYMAAAIASIAFSKSHAVVDGNVKRVLARLFCIDKPVNDSRSSAHFQIYADELIDPENPGDHNQAMMELGARICIPRQPACVYCPVKNMCLAHSEQRTEEYPNRIKKTPVPVYQIALGVVWKDGNVLITKRKEDGLLGGLWEFPGGKIKKAETAAEACVREIREETGIRVKIRQYLTHIRHAYSHFKIGVDVFICDFVSGKVRLKGPVDYRWIGIDEIDEYPFPQANHKFIKLLRDPELIRSNNHQ